MRYWFYKLQSTLHFFLARNTGICHGMEGLCFQIGYRYRQNTAYVNEESNWIHLCEDCQKINDEYWAEMWADYWSGRF